MQPSFFTHNRQQLIHTIRGSVAIIGANSSVQRSNDTSFTFEQESNFWYLTGVEVADWWVIIDGRRSKAFLVAPEVSDAHHIFDGSLSFDDAKRISGVDGVLSQDEAMSMLRELAKKHSIVYGLGDLPYAEHFDFVINPAPKKIWNTLERIFKEVQDCRPELATLRAIKQPEEIAMMKKAIKLTIDGFNHAKKILPTLRYEYEVEAEFSHYFRSRGATGHAYDPIVAGDKNACTLHYGQNNDPLKKSSVLLLDIGARVGGYAADISRTYALGTPTKRTLAVHGVVEQAHRHIIALLKPGLLVSEYHAQVDLIMKQALIDLGLLSDLSDDATYRRYFPHAISHGLGIDVHDSLGKPTVFLPGMVLTVEPGIYIPEECRGFRIEDDILITEQGHLNLSKALSTAL